MGPQLPYRHFKHLSLFVRPSVGAVRPGATPKPADPIATNHFSIRTQSDLVWEHLFNDILQDGRCVSRSALLQFREEH